RGVVRQIAGGAVDERYLPFHPEGGTGRARELNCHELDPTTRPLGRMPVRGALWWELPPYGTVSVRGVGAGDYSITPHARRSPRLSWCTITEAPSSPWRSSRENCEVVTVAVADPSLCTTRETRSPLSGTVVLPPACRCAPEERNGPRSSLPGA